MENNNTNTTTTNNNNNKTIIENGIEIKTDLNKKVDKFHYFTFRDPNAKQETGPVKFYYENDDGSYTLYKFDTPLHNFYGNNIMLRPALIIKMLIALIGKCKQDCSKGNKDKITSVSVKNQYIEFAGLHYNLTLSCRAGELEKISPFAFMFFIFKLHNESRNLPNFGDWNTSDIPPLCDYYKIMFDRFGLKRDKTKTEEQQLLEILKPLTKINVECEMKFDAKHKEDNEDNKEEKSICLDKTVTEPFLSIIDYEDEGKKCRGLRFAPHIWLDYFVANKQFKSITPNFLNCDKRQMRLMFLSLCLELSELNGDMDGKGMKIKKALKGYLSYPAKADKRSDCKHKERVLNDLKEIDDTRLFASLWFKYEDTTYSLNELAESELLKKIKFTEFKENIDIFFKINKNWSDYKITFEAPDERDSREDDFDDFDCE